MKNKLTNMKCLDLFIASQNEEDYNAIKEQITPLDTMHSPLLSFDLYTDYFSAEMTKLDRKNDINSVKKLASKFLWNTNLDQIFEDEIFEALVVTNKQQEIIWVNNGFKKMTGYSKDYAIKKTPSFLQGKETCEVTRNRIREKILSDKPFTDIVTNYKKDNTAYKCEIKIFPLFHNDITHYIALEKAVS